MTNFGFLSCTEEGVFDMMKFLRNILMREIIACLLIAAVLTGCKTKTNQPPVGTNASMCEMLKQKVEAEDYNSVDPATMKRKNPTDQAKLVKEYDSYSCPEIVDSAPSPYQTQ
jgi:hypothetical protein